MIVHQNLKNGQVVSLYDNLPFIFECFITYNTPSSTKKQCKNTEPENRQMAFFFFFFWQASSNLRDSFTVTFAQNSSILHWAMHQPITLSQLWSLTKWFEPVTEQLWLHFKLVGMHTNHLAAKQLLFKIAELEIQLCAWEQGDSLASIVDSVFEQSLHGQWFFSQYIWGSLWGQTCHFVIDGKSSGQARIPIILLHFNVFLIYTLTTMIKVWPTSKNYLTQLIWFRSVKFVNTQYVFWSYSDKLFALCHATPTEHFLKH